MVIETFASLVLQVESVGRGVAGFASVFDHRSDKSREDLRVLECPGNPL